MKKTNMEITETDEQEEQTTQPTGFFRATGRVLKTVGQHEGVRSSARGLARSARETAVHASRAGFDITKEVVRHPEVRPAIKNVGRLALVGAGIVGPDGLSLGGIAGAFAAPEVALSGALAASTEAAADLADKALEALPRAAWNNRDKIGKAAVGAARFTGHAVALPVRAGYVAAKEAADIHRENRAVRTDERAQAQQSASATAEAQSVAPDAPATQAKQQPSGETNILYPEFGGNIRLPEQAAAQQNSAMPAAKHVPTQNAP